MTSAASSFAYDEVPYDTEANADAHPSAIATLACLAGLSLPRMPSEARVLEIGCGNGENLLSAATYLPRASFVGFDLAESAIAAGNAAAKASALENVTLFAADIREVRQSGISKSKASPPRSFDYVVAHGMYSWVPDPIREDLLAVMHDALAPRGLGFLSVNALPGWELRRALRDLSRDATQEIVDPAAKVAETLRLVSELGRSGREAQGFFGALSAAAREYVAHVERATPPEAPFSRYVFHDLLADCNDPFSVEQLTERLARAGLRIVCEAPLRQATGGASGTPFLQVIVRRDDDDTAPAGTPIIDGERAIDLDLWADFARMLPSTKYRTTTGAIVSPVGEDGIKRAADHHAPGFVRVRDLVSDDDERRKEIARQLFGGFCDGVFTLVVERPSVITSDSSDAPPCVASHVRTRAAMACSSLAPTAVITNALHRSFRVPWAELAIVRLLDGKTSIAEITQRAMDSASASAGVSGSLGGALHGAAPRDAERFVASVLDRYKRHLFLVPTSEQQRQGDDQGGTQP